MSVQLPFPLCPLFPAVPSPPSHPFAPPFLNSTVNLFIRLSSSSNFSSKLSHSFLAFRQLRRSKALLLLAAFGHAGCALNSEFRILPLPFSWIEFRPFEQQHYPVRYLTTDCTLIDPDICRSGKYRTLSRNRRKRFCFSGTFL